MIAGVGRTWVCGPGAGAVLPCMPCAYISARSGGLSLSPESPWVSPHLLALSQARIGLRLARFTALALGLCPFTAFPVALWSFWGGGVILSILRL